MIEKLQLESNYMKYKSMIIPFSSIGLLTSEKIILNLIKNGNNIEILISNEEYEKITPRFIYWKTVSELVFLPTYSTYPITPDQMKPYCLNPF